LLYSFADELDDAYYILWHGNAAVNADMRVGDGNVGTGTLYADVVDATTAVRIAGVNIGSASGGIWSQNGNDAYYSIGAVGIGVNPPAAYGDGQAYIQELANPRIGFEGLYPNLMFYDWASSAAIGGVTFDSLNFELVFDATADLVGSVTITDTGVEAGYVNATSATITDVTASTSDLGAAIADTLTSGTQTVTGDVDIDGDFTLTGDATVVGTIVTTDLSVTSTLYAGTSISHGTSTFTPSTWARDLFLYEPGNTYPAGITLLSAYDGQTGVIEAVTHPSYLGRNRLGFTPGLADGTTASRWNFSSDGVSGLYVYKDHIEFTPETINNPYLIIREADDLVPSASNSTGVAGTMLFSGGYIYYCTEANSWGRVQLSTW